MVNNENDLEKPLTEEELVKWIAHYQYIRDNTKSTITRKIAERRIEALEIKLKRGDY